MTIARWYGGQAEVPSVFILVSRNFASVAGDRIARVSWNRNVLLARAAALGDEHQVEFVGVVLAGRGHDVELHRQVVAGVHLLEHRQRRHLRIAQIGFGVGAMDAPGQRLLLVAVDPDALALLAEDDRGAGVLAHRQHAAGGDIGVLQQVQRHEPVVGDASGSSRMARSCGKMPGRSRCETSWNARNASSLSASGAMRRTVLPSTVMVRTPSIGSLRQGVVPSGPAGTSGNRGSRPGRRHGASTSVPLIFGGERRRNASRLTTCARLRLLLLRTLRVPRTQAAAWVPSLTGGSAAWKRSP